MTGTPASIVVLVSGGGSNLQAILDACARGEIAGRVTAVISNRPEARGLERAHRHGAAAEVVEHGRFESREHFDAALMAAIDAHRPDLVVLAGFMRILTPGFVAHYAGRLLNIHPSLLPAYRGLDTHARALADAVSEHGASVHFVTGELDGGPVILQARIPVQAGDTPAALAARVLEKEHLIYPLAVRWFCAGRLRLADHRVIFDGRPLAAPLRLEDPAVQAELADPVVSRHAGPGL
ncbi:MAG TPA: phosphoribosylglycinamide formyltransferase [Thioalkalivibrio sp.]|nr:phosphoribosylglycinamide formyltransferase [Thioalkalivibrio sp.]